MGIIADKWASYALATIPHVSHDSIQYIQTRNAFYAGANLVMGYLIGAGEPGVPEDVAANLLSQIDTELNEFVAEVMEKARLIREQRAKHN